MEGSAMRTTKKDNCCEPSKAPGHVDRADRADRSEHPDHSHLLVRLSRAQGQIGGIEKMIAERRYCVDILVQFRAVMAALRGLEVEIFQSHLKHCVTSAMKARDPKEAEKKIKEISELLARRTQL